VIELQTNRAADKRAKLRFREIMISSPGLKNGFSTNRTYMTYLREL